MQAQAVSEEQMDERFNDGTKLPYGLQSLVQAAKKLSVPGIKHSNYA